MPWMPRGVAGDHRRGLRRARCGLCPVWTPATAAGVQGAEIHARRGSSGPVPGCSRRSPTPAARPRAATCCSRRSPAPPRSAGIPWRPLPRVRQRGKLAPGRALDMAGDHPARTSPQRARGPARAAAGRKSRERKSRLLSRPAAPCFAARGPARFLRHPPAFRVRVLRPRPAGLFFPVSLPAFDFSSGVFRRWTAMGRLWQRGGPLPSPLRRRSVFVLKRSIFHAAKCPASPGRARLSFSLFMLSFSPGYCKAGSVDFAMFFLKLIPVSRLNGARCPGWLFCWFSSLRLPGCGAAIGAGRMYLRW